MTSRHHMLRDWPLALGAQLSILQITAHRPTINRERNKSALFGSRFGLSFFNSPVA